jgi:hypothetical protein
MTSTHPPGADHPDARGTLRARRIRRALPLPLHDGDLDGLAASAALARGQAEAAGALGLLDLPGAAEPAASPRPLPDTAALAFRPDPGTFGTDKQSTARSGRRTGPWPLVAAAAVAGAVLVTTPLLHQKGDKKVTGMEDLDRAAPVATLGADSGGSHAVPDGGTDTRTVLTDGAEPAGTAPTARAPRADRHVPPAVRAHPSAPSTTAAATPGPDGTTPGVWPQAAPLDREMAPHNFDAPFPGVVPDPQPGSPDSAAVPTVPAAPGHAGKAPESGAPRSESAPTSAPAKPTQKMFPVIKPVLKPVTKARTQSPLKPATPAHTEVASPATKAAETTAAPATKPAKAPAKPGTETKAAAEPAAGTAHPTVSHTARTDPAKPQAPTSHHTTDTKPPAPPAPPAEPATPQYETRVVDATSVLHAGQSVSTDHVRVAMTQGGNLVIGDPATGSVLWSSGTSGSGNYAVFQADGNLVVYRADGSSLWTSGSAGNDGARMVLQDDGNVVIRSVGGSAVWSSGTVH